MSVGGMARDAAVPPQRATLREVAMDEARFCGMLTRHVTRLGGTPSRATGAFYDKVVALDSPADRLALVNRGQGWVRSGEHTSELQSLMRISYAVFCLKKNTTTKIDIE